MEQKEYNDLKKIGSVLINSEYNIDDYKRLLDKLEDEKSKLMFYYRIMFDNTNDAYYALMLEKAMYYQSVFYSYGDKTMFNFLEFMLKNNNYNKNIYIIGFPWGDPSASVWSMMTYIFHTKDGLNVECIFDDNNQRKPYTFDCSKMIKVFSFNELFSYSFKDNSIFIIANPKFEYISYYLNNNKQINNDNIFTFNVPSPCQRDVQYLCESFIKIDSNEVLIDGGSADLDTTLGFLEYTNGLYKKIYVIEPLKDYYDICIDKVKSNNLNNIIVQNVGLWNSDSHANFTYKDYGSSYISNDGNNDITVRSIDSILNGEEATIIKMDIEGAEYEALEGARNTIVKYNPILMVCIYHKPNDAIKLSNLVLRMNPNYKLFIRHYSYNIYETVMYFVPEDRVIKF